MKNHKDYLGYALVIGLIFLGLGGVIAAIRGSDPTDAQITAVTALLSSIIGGLIGHAAGSRTPPD